MTATYDTTTGAPLLLDRRPDLADMAAVGVLLTLGAVAGC